MQLVRPVPPPPNLPCKFALRKGKGTGTIGGWGDSARKEGQGRGQARLWKRLCPTPIRKGFPGKLTRN